MCIRDSSSIGTFGYQIYLKDKNGNLTNLGWTDKTTYTYKASTSGEYTFVIKSAYSIFKTNQSNGLEIKVSIKGDSSEGNKLKATASTLCVPVNGTVDAKKAIKASYDGIDVTDEVTITASTVDTSTTGEKTITYTAVSYTHLDVYKRQF